jgi:hypothetical protein
MPPSERCGAACTGSGSGRILSSIGDGEPGRHYQHPYLDQLVRQPEGFVPRLGGFSGDKSKVELGLHPRHRVDVSQLAVRELRVVAEVRIQHLPRSFEIEVG